MTDWVSIATIAVSLIAPFVKKAGEKAAEKAGETIFNLIQHKFKGDDEAESTLKNFEKNPKRHETALVDILKERAETDADFGAELKKLIEAANEKDTATISQKAVGKGIAQAAGTGASATVSIDKMDD